MDVLYFFVVMMAGFYVCNKETKKNVLLSKITRLPLLFMRLILSIYVKVLY